MSKRNMTPVQTMLLGNILTDMREQLESQTMTGTEIAKLVSAAVGFCPPESAIQRMITDLEITLPQTTKPRTDVARLAELVVMMGRVKPELPARKAVEALLLEGDIKGAYAARGPLVF